VTSGGQDHVGDRPDETLAGELDRVRAEADQTRDEVAWLVAARQTSASRELRPNVESASWRSAAGSTSIPRHASAGGRWVHAPISSRRTKAMTLGRAPRPTTTISGPRVRMGTPRHPRRPRPSRSRPVGGRGHPSDPAYQRPGARLAARSGALRRRGRPQPDGRPAWHDAATRRGDLATHRDRHRRQPARARFSRG